MKRYAEGTTVSVQSSRGEISGILTSHGCERMAWGTAPEGDTLQFELGGKLFRFAIGKPTLADVQSIARADGKALHLIHDQPLDAPVGHPASLRRRAKASAAGDPMTTQLQPVDSPAGAPFASGESSPASPDAPLCRHSAGGVRCGIALVESTQFPGFYQHVTAPAASHYPRPWRTPEAQLAHYLAVLDRLRVEAEP
jgi:hypothetical protein